MLKNVKWGTFKVGELFDVNTSKKRFDANKVTVLKSGRWPYVVRTAANNGHKGYINEDESYLNEGNTISFGQDTATMFYQEKPYFTGDKIKVLKPKRKEFNKSNAQFFISTMMKAFSSFSWGASSFSVDIIKNQNLTLPISDKGEIDFNFMERFLNELESERMILIEKFLTNAKLNDYHLTPEEKKALNDYENVEFFAFDLIKIFTVKNSGNILSRDIIENSGNVPYLCASRENNSVSSYISYDEKYLDKGNCVFIGGKTFVVSYQENDFYSNDSHNLILHLKDKEKRTRLNQLYLATCVEKSLSHKYSWGNSISNRKIQHDKIYLPVKDNQPDLSSMGTFMSAIQKLVIKDLVQYVDAKRTIQ
ncbi:restriction endonuclease subunit S [Shewanella algae]|uniref:restriction endonuclease subunit S n=1 Tax=Shewanella algae TaxID=38313 RepID=UPI002358AD97|nr:restriction endonuclease subunit S [Shewanella algae]MDC8855983.1 restriction endonuclease subunit S [Shewanella algae]